MPEAHRRRALLPAGALLLVLSSCATAGKSTDSGGTSTGTGADDTGLCSLATDPDGDGHCADDCAPEDPLVHPGALEICNDQDDDCDGEIDEDPTLTWYLDEDGDGYGGAAVQQCDPPARYADNGADCDDGDAATHPGAEERSDGVDNDCDGAIDEGSSGGDALSISLDWDGAGLSVTLSGGAAATYELGMAETGSGASGWYGETCIAGPEPGGVEDYGYDVCHSLSASGGRILSVYPDVGAVRDGRTLFSSAFDRDLTYLVADPASADCWVMGDDVDYYLALGCWEL